MNNKLIILSAGFFVYLLLILFIFGYTPCNDGDGYIEYAMQCLSEKQPYPTSSNIQNDSFIWNIGSINIIALCLWIFNSIYPLLILMCLMKAFIAYFTSKISQYLLGDRFALITLITFILYPNNWGQSTTIISEIPSAFLCIMAIYIILTKDNYKTIAFAGVLMAFSNWFRAIIPVFLLSLTIYYLICKRENLKRKILPLLLGYTICICLIGIETYSRTGYFIYKGDSLWFNICDDAYDNVEVAPHYGQEMYEKGKPRYIENINEYNCFERSDIWKNRCLEWIMSNKIEWIKKIPKRIIYMYYNDIDNITFALNKKNNAEDNYITIPYRHLFSELNHLSAPQYLALFNMVYYYAILSLFILSIIHSYLSGNTIKFLLPLLIIVIGTLSITFLIHGETRFKDPFMPYIIIISSIYIEKIFLYHNRKSII